MNRDNYLLPRCHDADQFNHFIPSSISGMPSLPDYKLYAASLAVSQSQPNMSFGLGLGQSGAGAGQGMNQFNQQQQQQNPSLQQQSNQQQQNQPSHSSPGMNTFMQFPPASFPGSQQQQQGHSNNPHQRAMTAVAGLAQGMSAGAPQHFGQSPSGMVGSSSAPNTAQTGAAPSPQFGMVGPAGFQPGSPTSANNSPFINTGPMTQNATSPAAQAMSAMSSMSGIPSSNTSASANTPISPATAYTPNFSSPNLSHQAAFNAAAAAGLGVNFSAFGLPNSECTFLSVGHRCQ